MTAGRTVNSQSVHWCTPHKYVEAVHAVFHGTISLDPCSNRYSIVNAETSFSLPKSDGLKREWDFPTIYVNPPYGADRERGTTIKHWIARCAHAHAVFDSEVIALIPVATNTRHWKDHIWGNATGVCFLYDTRLRFLVEGKDEGKGAPMACAMIYWGNNFALFAKTFKPHGAVVDLSRNHLVPAQNRSRLKQATFFEG